MQLQAILRHDAVAGLRNLDVPTLVAHGTEDEMIVQANGQHLASLVPDARLETMDGVGHLFWWEQPERSAKLVRAHAR
ncbi:alpha/beta fold hydrolase [Actinokineospora sp.]|uniref:alpha/beta fold hydrolase n=1 Tax=Actinokineospora sp. TaxID=1872133 RepID=UPI003D6B1279